MEWSFELDKLYVYRQKKNEEKKKEVSSIT